MTPLLAVVLALTVHRLTRLVTADTFPPILAVREWILSRWPSTDTVFTTEAITHTGGEPQSLAGADLFQIDAETYGAIRPHWFGELVSCSWCASVWIAAVAVPVFWLWPDVMIWVGLIPAASSVAGLLSRVE